MPLLARNIIQGFDFISNHITHLYMLWFPDFVNPAYSGVIEKKLWDELILRFAPPAYRIHNRHIPPGKSYLNALHARKMVQEAILGLAGSEIRPFPGGLDIRPQENCPSILKERHSKVMACLSFMLGRPWKEWIENTYFATPESAIRYLQDLNNKDPFEGRTEPLPANEIVYGEKYTHLPIPFLRFIGDVRSTFPELSIYPFNTICPSIMSSCALDEVIITTSRNRSILMFILTAHSKCIILLTV